MACFSSFVLSLASTPQRKRDATKAKVKYGAVYVMGNADGDAAADGSGSGVAGTYDPETGLVSLAMYNFIPNTGAFGTFSDSFVFDEKPAL